MTTMRSLLAAALALSLSACAGTETRRQADPLPACDHGRQLVQVGSAGPAGPNGIPVMASNYRSCKKRQGRAA